MEVPVYSESTEAGVQKTLSARREGDWTALNLQHTGIRDKKWMLLNQAHLWVAVKVLILREKLQRQLQQFQAHTASMTLEGAPESSSNTTAHSTTSQVLYGAVCPRQGAAAASGQ